MNVEQTRESSELLRSTYFDSTSKLPNPSLNYRQSPIPSAYQHVNRDNLCNPTDRIGRNYTHTSIGLSMKVASKNVKEMLSLPITSPKHKKNASINHDKVDIASTAPSAFESKSKIVDAAKSDTGKFPLKPKKPEPLKPLPSVGSVFSLREEHRLLRSKPNFSTVAPLKTKTLDEYINPVKNISINDYFNSDETKRYDKWDPEPICDESVEKLDLSTLSIEDRIKLKSISVLSLNDAALFIFKNGILTSAGSGHRLPVLGIV